MSEKQQKMPDSLEAINIQTPFKKGLYMTIVGLLVSGITALWFSLLSVQKRLDECHTEQSEKIENLKNEQLAQMKEQEQRLSEIEEKYRQILFNVQEAQREVRKKTNSQ